jgi:hypothetical protein
VGDAEQLAIQLHGLDSQPARCPMLRVLLVLLLAGASSAVAQSRGTQPGDSVWVIVHRVRPDKRAQYDSVMQAVWAPAAQRTGKKYRAYGKLVEQRRRYVPTELASDSTYPYVYLYFGRPDVPPTTGGGNAVLRAAGLSKAQADSFASAIRSFTVSGTSGALVDEPHR